jgi:hypothetical protein
MIPDTLYFQIKGKGMVKDTWDALTKEFETRSHMFTIDLHWRLQDKHCPHAFCDNASIEGGPLWVKQSAKATLQ